MDKTFLGSDIGKLGFGMMRLPSTDGRIDAIRLNEMVDRFMQAGFTYFDTAFIYHGGLSEEAARDSLVKRYPREAFQLADKMPPWEVKEPADLDRIFSLQLERTGAGYFDYYLLHALDRNHLPKLDEFDMWNHVLGLKAKGLVRHAGFSFHDKAEVLEEILTKHPEMEFVQLQINYADWESADVQARACYEVARRHQVPIIIMEPVKGGNLAAMTQEVQSMFRTERPDSSVASWAMRFCGSLEGIITVLSGMSNLEQLEDNLATMAHFEPLSDRERVVLANVMEANAAIPMVPCTKCRYCVDGCPQKIDIPGVIEALNFLKAYANLPGAKGHYEWVTGQGGKASDCIACGVCEGHCPQHIAIIDAMRDSTNAFA